MKKNQDQVSEILLFVSQFPAGLSLEEISNKFTMPRRTLQRRLAHLIKTNKLIMVGRSRGVRYKQSVSVDYSVFQLHSTKLIAKEPSTIQKPVYYNRDFLESYQPNVSHYLTDPILQHLKSLGHTDGDRPAGTYAREILSRLLIDLSWNSSRLEGNTYSLLETEYLLEQGKLAKGKTPLEAQMILNHKDAIEFLVTNASDIGFNRHSILNLHALLANNLLANPLTCGRLRTIPVGIRKTKYSPVAIPQVIEECFQKILDKATFIKNPFEQAFFVMVHLPYLQPFEDVNKRVSRLAANIPFIRNNLSPLSFVDVSDEPYISGILNMYESNKIEILRDVFIWAYERSSARYSVVCQSIGAPDLFRLRYRGTIGSVILAAVKDRLNKLTADLFIKKQAEMLISENDRARFVEIVETELSALHEGNIARYRITQREFLEWHGVWVGF